MTVGGLWLQEQVPGPDTLQHGPGVQALAPWPPSHSQGRREPHGPKIQAVAQNHDGSPCPQLPAVHWLTESPGPARAGEGQALRVKSSSEVNVGPRVGSRCLVGAELSASVCTGPPSAQGIPPTTPAAGKATGSVCGKPGTLSCCRVPAASPGCKGETSPPGQPPGSPQEPARSTGKGFINMPLWTLLVATCDFHFPVTTADLRLALIKFSAHYLVSSEDKGGSEAWGIEMSPAEPPHLFLSEADSDQTRANYSDLVICLYVLIFNCFHVQPITEQWQIEINFLSASSQPSQ